MIADSRKPSLAAIALGALALAAVLGAPRPAHARPTYFETLKNLYSIPDDSNLDACGVCHYLWTGTGARNPFGQTVEQQLYLGKSITQSLIDAEVFDSDGDGFTNGDEIITYMTLPGYSCDNYFDAIGAPPGYDTYIEPLVASCLEPLDIRVVPSTEVGFLTKAGDVEIETLTIFNNGSVDVLTIDSVAFVDGSSPLLSLSGPATPLNIPLGGSVEFEVSFSPLAPAVVGDTIRIESNDPDEDPLDITVSGIGYVINLAPAAERATCLAGVQKAMRKYTKTHLSEWSQCYATEVGGVACDSGRRDLKIMNAAAKLRASVGGAKDKRCTGSGITATNLGLPDECGGDCAHIEIDSLTDYADCLICRQDAATADFLDAALGTSPPDLPPNQAANADALSCQESLLKGTQKAVGSIQKALGDCEVGNVTAASPVDCTTSSAEAITKAQEKANAAVSKCADTGGLEGCLFEPMPDASCLGVAAEQIAGDIVDAVFDQAE